MELLPWIGIFVVTSLLWIWILFWGGADRLEGSALTNLFFWLRASEWTADGIRVFAAGAWIIQAIWFAIGLFSPEVRLVG